MKTLYPSPKLHSFIISSVKIILTAILLVAAAYSVANAQAATSQELVFKNSVLKSGKAGEDGAIYLFSSVMTGIDAQVKITNRSSAMVKLVTIDLTSSGFEKAFQPQVTYGNNTAPAGHSDWWMEFEVSFLKAGTNTAAAIDAFNVTGLDIDGNNDKISEYASFYGLQTFTLEKNTQLTVSSIMEKVKGAMTAVGKRFDGPVSNYMNVDTIATAAMVTNSYVSTNSFKLRTGATSTGVSGAADRMYSFWFKTFTYSSAIVNLLPVTVINWNATLASNNVSLQWTTTVEKNASHFIIERSFDGAEFSDIAMLFATGNSDINVNYSYTDKVPAANTGLIYYRLKMVDMDGVSKISDLRMVRIGKTAAGVKIMAYPNPVVSDVRVTIPQSWQGRSISYQLTNANGQVIKSYTVQNAGQTEVVGMSQVPAGMYILRVINGSETAVQTVVKSAR